MGAASRWPWRRAGKKSGIRALTFRQPVLSLESMSKTTDKTLSELLRDALVNRPGSYREIEAASGVANPVLVNFVNGKKDMRLATAEALIRHFGIRVLPPKPTRRKKG